jgi:hypothetical protein
MDWLIEIKKLEIAQVSDPGQKTKLLNIADGLRGYYTMTHPEFSPVWLRFPQSITLLQSVFPPAANAGLNPGSFREFHGAKPTIRSLKPETHRQFRPPGNLI